VNGDLVMDEKKPRRKKTGGRKPGSLNRKTIIGKDIAETLRNWLGFDNESVERTGMIDGDGYRGRLALKAMWDDQRPVDPQYVALAKFLFGYAYGTPGKHQQEGVQRETLIFSTSHGYLPWDARAPAAAALNARSVLMIEGKAEEIALQAEARAAEAAAPKDDAKKGDTEIDGEVLELVVPPPESPDAFGGGGRGR
jgi:hypothetical protein